jgi:hypothetical protein
MNQEPVLVESTIDNRQSTMDDGAGVMDVLSGAHAAYSLYAISINLSAAWQGK